MTVRKYSSRSQQTTLSSPITSTATTMTVVNGASIMGGKTLTGTQTYTVVIDPDTALEEIVDVTVYSSGNTLTITRGVDGPTPGTGFAHSAGAVVRHMAIGRDYQEANDHIENTTTAHGLTVANVVKTTDTGTVSAGMIATGAVTSDKIADGAIVNGDINSSAQIAYSKLNLTNTIVDADINASAAIAWSKIAPSSTVSTTELGYLDGVTSAVQTQIDSKLATATASSTYAPLASPALTGTPTAPTATAGTNTTQVATTAYVGTAISNLVAGAPTTLDTLDEIAAALADTANFSDTVVLKTGSTMSGDLAMGTNKITGLGNPTNAQDAATKYYIDNTYIAPSNLTGPITSTGSATAVASQTGTGSTFVMNTSPTLVTPVLGVATATSVNGTTIPTSKTLVATDSTTYVVPSQTGNSGKYLTTDGTISSWGTVTGYSAPTIGSTSIASGATVTTIAGLTLTSPTVNDPKLNLSINAQTGTTYTFVLTDNGKLITASNASAQTYSIPTNASVAFPVGTQINLIQIGAGQVTVSATTPGTTTVLSNAATAAGPKCRNQYASLTAIKVATDTWYVIGDIA